MDPAFSMHSILQLRIDRAQDISLDCPMFQQQLKSTSDGFVDTSSGQLQPLGHEITSQHLVQFTWIGMRFVCLLASTSFDVQTPWWKQGGGNKSCIIQDLSAQL